MIGASYNQFRRPFQIYKPLPASTTAQENCP